MENLTLKAETRTATGTRAVRKLRETGQLPAVIYGHGEPPVSISLSQHDVELALTHGARTLDVAVKGDSKPYLIKEVQYDHLGHLPIHLDLARVDLNERVTVSVGIELRGTPVGVNEGGILEQNVQSVEVECVVTNIPETLRPLVSSLALGESLLVKDLELPPGVRCLTDGDERIATVRALVEAAEPEPGEEGEEEAAMPERIGRVRKDEGGAEG